MKKSLFILLVVGLTFLSHNKLNSQISLIQKKVNVGAQYCNSLNIQVEMCGEKTAGNNLNFLTTIINEIILPGQSKDENFSDFQTIGSLNLWIKYHHSNELAYVDELNNFDNSTFSKITLWLCDHNYLLYSP